MVASLIDGGFTEEQAKVKVCQEIFMIKLARSKYKDSIIFKGGIIMYQLTKEIRRSTADVDIDLVKLSIADASIIEVLNHIGSIETKPNIRFEVRENSIERLRHESYEGKRVRLSFRDDSGDNLSLKLDIGVHTKYQIQQGTLIFDMFCSDEGVELLANPVEQMIVEKTSSFIRFGPFSTRMKDFFDIYYLINNINYSKQIILDLIQLYFIDSRQVESMEKYIESMLESLQSDIL